MKENWDCIDGKIKNNYKNITKNEWIELCLNIDILNSKPFINNYSNNVGISSSVGLQELTFYRIDPYETIIDNWNWKKCDNENNHIYTFESIAEKEVADRLKNLNLTLWGKNWFNGSKISFEYFLRQKGNYLISKQYPDFFVIKNNKKYLIEVKSFDGKNQASIEYQDYFNKVESIKKVYDEIAQITNQIMVVIVKQKDKTWVSYVYEKDKQPTTYTNRNLYDFLK